MKHARRFAAPVLLEALECRQLLSTLPNDYTPAQWQWQNTGQTLSSHPVGPATGTAGADVSAAKAWDLTTGSRNVVVAVLDSGIDLTHPDLTGNLFTNPFDGSHGYNALDGSNNIQDTDGHGTAVAGVLGAVGNNGTGITGIDWSVSILPVKVVSNSAAGATSAAMVAGINYVISLKQRGVNIVAINASEIETAIPSQDVISAIQQAGNAGILFVDAAGNGSLNLDATLGPTAAAFWSSIPNLITVAATNNQDQLWSASNYGATTVDIAAPGVDVMTTWNNSLARYLPLSGTSFSAPMVAGVAALCAAYVPGATATQIRDAIFSGVDPLSNLSGVVATGGRLNAYKALVNLKGNQPALGYVDTANQTAITGWAFAPQAGADPVTVRTLVDGQILSDTVANIPRGDLTAVVGSPNHGFSVPLGAALPFGTHTVSVYALGAPAGTSTLLGSVTITKNAPTGWVDAVNGAVVSGWAFDADVGSASIPVHVWVDGKYYTAGNANISRPDLTPVVGSAGHGFSLALNLPQGNHTVQVYFIDEPSGQGILDHTFQVNVQNQPPVGYIDVASASTISGWVADPDTPAQVVQMRIDIDGQQGGQFPAGIPRPDVAPLFGGNGNHGFIVAMPTLAAGFHRVDVWAFDTSTNAPTLLGSLTINASGAPTGQVDPVSNSTVSGWAYDPKAGAGAIQVQISLDGIPRPLLTANLSRPELASTLGSTNHGFRMTLPTLIGSHRLAVSAIDPDTLNLVALKTIALPAVTPPTHTPTGWVDAISPTGTSGWALDPANPSASVRVRVDVDGVTGTPTTASIPRPDLVATYGSANHGFSIPLNLTGTHLVEVYFLNPSTGAATLASQALVNNTPPRGFVDVLSANLISGWAQDPNVPTSPIKVRVDVDDMAGVATTAQVARPDLQGLLGSTNHGFSIPGLSLGKGTHRLTVRAIDPFTLATVVIGSGTVTV